MTDELYLQERQSHGHSTRVEEDTGERPPSHSTYLFAPPLDRPPDFDVAQRLITLSLAGLADELTWASY